MNFEARQDDRGYALIARFEDGFASGWKMAVPEVFREALDIKLTPRLFNKRKEMLWTQGRLYEFHEGDMIYDIPHAHIEWEEALKKIKVGVQVQFASSSRWVAYETIKVNISELEISRKKEKAKQEKTEIVNGLTLERQRIDYGSVRFRVYRPNEERTALKEFETLECTQDDFVAFLQTGIVRTKDNMQMNLFVETA